VIGTRLLLRAGQGVESAAADSEPPAV